MPQDWLQLAKTMATFSKDPSTKCGAVIINSKNHVVGLGYNGFPKKIEDKPELLNNREEKLKRVIHAEMNAIFDAKCDLDGCVLYVWPFFPCAECFKNIIQVGIVKVIAPECLPERWHRHNKIVEQLSLETGVELEFSEKWNMNYNV